MTPAFIYIFVIFVSKNREKRNKKKKNWPLWRVLKPKHSAKYGNHIYGYILCDRLVFIGLVIYVMDYSMYWTIFCVSDLLYVSDSCYVLNL